MRAQHTRSLLSVLGDLIGFRASYRRQGITEVPEEGPYQWFVRTTSFGQENNSRECLILLAAIAAPFAGEAVAARRRAPSRARAARSARCVASEEVRSQPSLPSRLSPPAGPPPRAPHPADHVIRHITHALTIAIFSRTRECTNSAPPLRPPHFPGAGWVPRPPRLRWAFRPRPRPRWRCRV